MKRKENLDRKLWCLIFDRFVGDSTLGMMNIVSTNKTEQQFGEKNCITSDEIKDWLGVSKNNEYQGVS